MGNILIKNILLVNEGRAFHSDILFSGGRIEKIAPTIEAKANAREIDGSGKILLPGIIDTHVHFREPGVTTKADLFTESCAAVAGGVTSFMEMPNTIPQTTSIELLEEKMQLAAQKSLANYSFYLGATNENIEELKKAKRPDIGAVKVFMGSSTGNMLVDDEKTLDKIFSEVDNLIAVHAEVEEIIEQNLEKAREKYGEDIPVEAHPEIRGVEGCYESTKKAVRLAEKNNARLHVLHLTTAEELEFFQPGSPEKKKITTEACPHHLWFDSTDYAKYGNRIKCNPAIKEPYHKKALLKGLIDSKIDMIASDHAPHLEDEKNRPFMKAPAGIPLVQHSLMVVLEFVKRGELSMEDVVRFMCHNPGLCYGISERGYLREGYFADAVIIDPEKPFRVSKENILYKCNWSPFDGMEFGSTIISTFVNGNEVYSEGKINTGTQGSRLKFT